jgi:hypothetical protein
MSLISVRRVNFLGLNIGGSFAQIVASNGSAGLIHEFIISSSGPSSGQDTIARHVRGEEGNVASTGV